MHRAEFRTERAAVCLKPLRLLDVVVLLVRDREDAMRMMPSSSISSAG